IVNDSLNSGAVKDTLKSGAGNDSINSGTGNDLVDAGEGDDTVLAGAGNDTIIAGTGMDKLDAGAGDDVFSFKYSGIVDDQALTTLDTVIGGSGTDTVLIARDAADDVTLDDTIFTNWTDVETLDISNAKDTLDEDTRAGSVEIDSLAMTAMLHNIVTGKGNDYVHIGSGFNAAMNVEIGGGNDEIDASLTPISSSLTVNVVATNDRNPNLTLDDTLKGGSGTNDTIKLTANSDKTVTNAVGFENIIIVDGKDINGDKIGDSSADLTLTDDVVDSGQVMLINASALRNPEGTGTFTFDGSAETNGSFNLTGGANADTLKSGNGNDTIDGGAGANSIDGGLGDDKITTGSGNDTVSGNFGNDTIDGGAGANSIDGGFGDDIITTGFDNDTVIGGTGNDTIDGGAGANSIDGGLGADKITTGSGNDTVLGNAGNDVISTGDGADSIDGGNGNDSIDGGAGEDSLWGSNGKDTLTGGSGIDRFFYTQDDIEVANVDTIMDFVSKEDKIVFEGISGSSRDQPTKTIEFKGNFGSFGASQGAILEGIPGVSANDGIIEAVFEADINTLWFNLNEDGALNGDDLQIILTGVTKLDQADFAVL
ncbi:MAG: calcium-binding protein, partial [Methylococcaceae bacterium]